MHFLCKIADIGINRITSIFWNQNSPIQTFILIFLLITGAIRAQNNRIDSLQNELALHTKKDTIRVEILGELTFANYRIDLEKAEEYLNESKSISKKIYYKSGLARAAYLRGVIEMTKSNYDSARAYLERSIGQYVNLEHRKRPLSNSYLALGAVYYYQGDYDKSLVNYENSLRIREEIGQSTTITKFNIAGIKAKIGNYEEAMNDYKEVLADHKKDGYDLGVANCLNSMAAVYNEQGNFPLALEYNNKSLMVSEKINDSIGIARSLHNLGSSYENQQHYDKALDYYFKSLVFFEKKKNKNNIAESKANIASIYIIQGELKKATKFLYESLDIANEINDKEQIANCLNKLGYVFLTLQDFSQASQYYEKSKNINIEINNQLGLVVSHIGASKVFLQSKDNRDALNEILSAKDISEKHSFLTQQRDIQQILSKIYENTNDHKKALESYKEFKILNDSVFNKANIEKATQLEYEYKYKKALDSANIRELKLTKTVLTTSQDLVKTKQNYLWAVIGILVISILSGSFVFYQKYKTVKIKNQNIVTEQKLLRSQMTPHFIFNSLSVLQGMILNKEEKKSVTYLSKFSKLLRIVLENSRDKIVPLIQELDAIDNYMILQNLDADLPYDYSLEVDENIDINRFLIPPMLIQPFIENAIEHAFTADQEYREIEIHLTFEHRKLSCIITDNGIGIDTTSNKPNTKKKSLATTITAERLGILGKDFKVPSGITIEDRKKHNEQGTKVILIVPYKVIESS